MGNSNISPTTIQNLNFRKSNSLIFSSPEELEYKKIVKGEKKKWI